MFKRVAVLFVVGLLAFSVGAVGGASAQTSDWTLDKSSETVTFGPDSDTITDTVTITNDDENNSVDIQDISIGGSHTVVDQPSTVGPGGSADIEVELSANDPGSATLSVQSSSKTESVDYTVETPAYVEISGIPEWADDEGVLRGNSRTAQITVEEVGGNQGFSGIDVGGDTGGLDVSGLEGTSVNAGGSTTVSVTFTADSGADQHDDIGGSLDLDPNEESGTDYDVESSVNLESYVAYPPYFGEAGLSIDTIEFDEPRSAGSISRSATIGIENAGDRELDFGQVSTGSMPFDVVVQDQPDTIARRSTARIDVEITADTGMSEGTSDFQVTLQSNDGGVDSTQLTDSIRIEHDIEMAVDPTQVRTGDIPIGDAKSSSITVSEQLGYKDINDLEMSLSEGPESYVEVTDGVDSTIAAGGSSNVGYEIQFDPDADIGTEYTWTFEIEADNVESEEVTITATPIPLNLDPLRQSLEEAPGGSQALDQTSQQTLQLVNDMDEQIRAGEVPQQDITTVLTFGDGVVRYLEALAATDELIAEGEYDAAQEELVRAAVAYDTMTTYSEAIEDDALGEQAISVRETAGGELQERIETQESHYEEQLAAEDTAPIEEAAIKRQLARIAALQGDTERSRTLESEADTAFEEYSTLVAEGETRRQEAVGIWNGMESNMFVTVLGQQFIVNPIHYDEFEKRSETLLSRYGDAEAAFTEAGETTRAETIAQERTQRANSLTVARWSLFASIGISALLIVSLIIHTARSMYWYVQDSRESISGDFLVG